MLLNPKNLNNKLGINTSDNYIRGYGSYDNLSERANLDAKTIFNSIIDLIKK